MEDITTIATPTIIPPPLLVHSELPTPKIIRALIRIIQ
jgi:hypothetical protein